MTAQVRLQLAGYSTLSQPPQGGLIAWWCAYWPLHWVSF